MRVWCLMQIAEQDMRFTEDPYVNEGKNIGYLDPFRISEDAHTVVMGPDSDLFQGKTKAEIAKIRVEEQDKQELAVSSYIANAFFQYQDRSVVCAPYFFKRHWICMYIYLYDARVLVLDSADFPQSSYQNFLDILNRAYKHYKFKDGRYDLKKKFKPLHVKTKLPCHKQPPGSVHCGYYVCEFLRPNGRYTNNPKKAYKCSPSNQRLTNEDLMNICEDFSRFIMKEVLHFEGKYFDLESTLAEPQYRDLVDIAKLDLNHDEY